MSQGYEGNSTKGKKMSNEQKEKCVLYFWCPTCKKHLVVEIDSPIICGSPVCAVCHGQVWRKSEEWYEQEKKCGRVTDE